MNKKLYFLIGILLIGLFLNRTLFQPDYVKTQQEEVNEAIEKALSEGGGHIKLKGELVLDSLVNQARMENNHFLFNLRFGMIKQEYTDSLDNLPNYKDEKLIISFDKGQLEFEIHPFFENEYLQTVELRSVSSEIKINTKLTEQPANEFLYKQSFFSIPYVDISNFIGLTNLYQAEYGNPILLKGVKESRLFIPDITGYIEWITKFNRSEQSDVENRRDSFIKYRKGVTNITETLVTDTFLFRNKQTQDLVHICHTKRNSISKIQFTEETKKRSHLKEILIIYTPDEAIKYREKIKLWEESLSDGIKERNKIENERMKKEAINGI